MYVSIFVIAKLCRKTWNPLKHPLSLKIAQQKFLRSVTSRMTVTQVIEGVKSSSSITFDFIMYTIAAGCITSAGLMSANPIDIAAAMCIEPVIATVLCKFQVIIIQENFNNVFIAAAFGTVVRDKGLIKTGIRNNFVVLLICLLVGFIYGLIALNWWKDV